MPQDALTYSFIVNELNKALRGGIINKITMPFKDEIILSIRNKGQNYFLLISLSNHSRMHLIKETKPSPLTPYSFCMHLRKNMGGGIIESITQEPFERIININFLFRNELGIQEDKKLVLEIMGRYSNAILVNQQTQKITDCAKHIPIDDNIKRAVMPGLIYSVPIQDNKFAPLDKEKILHFYPKTDDSAKDLINQIKGISPVSINEALHNAEPNDSLSLFNSLYALFNDEAKPCILLNYHTNDREELYNPYIDFFIRPYNSIKGDYIFFSTLNETMNCFFENKDLNERLKSKSSKYLTLTKNNLKRAAKKLSDFHQKMKDCENLEDDRIFGELITANIYKLKQGATELITQNYYNNTTAKIPLDPMLSPPKNAQKYYKKYSKKRRALTTTVDLITKAEQEVLLYQALKEDLESISSLDELTEIIENMSNLKLITLAKQTKKPTLSPIRSEEFDGFKIKIGKNNIQNDRLVKQANKDDLWFHIKDFAGSHVIVETHNKQVPQSVILHAARLAAQHSKVKILNKAEVDYTQIKYVHKQAGATLGKVSYKNHKTVIVKL